jgi:hypothetical protein
MICSASLRSPPAAILSMAPTERPGIGYAMIFPAMAFVKVVAMQGCRADDRHRRELIAVPVRYKDNRDGERN